MLYASVRILNAPYNIDKSYDYHVPLHLEDRISEGSIVVVPFGGGNKTRNALVEKLKTDTKVKQTKPVLGVPGKYLFIKKELLELCKFMSEHLFCSVGDAARCIIPSGVGVGSVPFYYLGENGEENAAKASLNQVSKNVLEYIIRNGRVSESELKSHFGVGAVQCAKALTGLGICETENGYECRVNTKSERYAEAVFDEEVLSSVSDGKISLTPKQKVVYELLLQYESPCPLSELTQAAGVGASVINELSKKGVCRIFDVEYDRSEDVLGVYESDYEKDFTLSDEQSEALRRLSELYYSEKPEAALLWGVTGSGKTNVILKLIDKVIADGKTVIVLVPEIALTSQTVGRFAARYKKEGIALLHSALSAGERMDAWKRINEGEVKIVIGTRSAVFAPIDNLGLIVMDEEHDSSFKSDRSPKYHAREIAKFRCVFNNALLVMASATPSIESFYKAKSGKYSLVTLRERFAGAELPTVDIYDMKSEPYYVMPEDEYKPEDDAALTSEAEMFEGGGVVDVKGLLRREKSAEDSAIPLMIGKKLKEEIQGVLDRKEQAILFINRRGYRAFATCRSCGYVFTCPNCSVSMTHHKNRRTGQSHMVCHYCGYTEKLPQECPRCKKEKIMFMGSGTQLLEETLSKDFPSARVLRMDADTTTFKFSHDKILREFREGAADILVGTQMVAKGHDFPNVSLVGVVLADTSLYVNDFRANEKTFSLLTQVLGRAGRKEKTGRAVLQTYSPGNEVLELAAKQDYERFYDMETEFRRSSVFPPYCDIVTLSFSSEVETDLLNAVKIFGAELDSLAKSEYQDVKFILYGPFRNEIYKIAGRYRMRYIIKCRDSARLRAMLSSLLKKYAAGLKNVTLSADVNPANL